MKLNLKRVALGLTMAVCLFSFTINSKAETAPTEIDANIEKQMEQFPEPYLKAFVDLKDEDVQAFKAKMESDESVAALSATADSWQSIKGDLGALVSIGKDVTVKATEEGYSATVNAVFEKQNLDFTVTIDPRMTKVVSATFHPEKTANSQEDLYGWLAVGAIVLAAVIVAVRKYNGASDGSSEEGNANAAAFVPAESVADSVSAEPANLVDDLELVAVITAAIAASTGSSPSGLVVRSIRRAPAGKWKNA
ncbi:sodium pump decarboxylase subunit gamma [Lacrimispora sp. JR3]|uniref:sodium pump decarboxylase subunit gamma n=1 Tax=Lacrimispora sinapis TaxID=3111456 RepID=UPI003747DA8F